jgi:hypothetical protein
MSRLISKQYSDALKEPSDLPPLDLGDMDDNDGISELIDSNDRIMHAIASLSASVGLLCKSVLVAMPKPDPALAVALQAVADGQDKIVAQLKNESPRRKWVFKVVRDQYGDLERVEAVEK